jgi:hypothetical protein
MGRRTAISELGQMSGDTEKRSRLKQWLESGEAKLHPAAFPQRELWEASPVPATDVSNNICTVTKVKGLVSRELSEKALAMVVERQEILRLSILPGNNGPVQLVRKTRKPALRFRLAPPDFGDQALDNLIDELIRTPFDLVAGPLYRVEVITLSAEEHVLVFVIHHAIADGWTLGIFMTDLFTAYASLVLGVSGGLEPLSQTYTEWGAADRSFWQPKVIRARLPFWVEQLAGAERLFDAPEIPPADVGKRGRWVSEIPGDRIESLRESSSRLSATLFSTVLTAFQVVMASATGKEDILVGSPVAQRNKKVSWETMGSFAGIVPLRSKIDKHLTYSDQVAVTHQMTLDSFAHAMPFSELVTGLEEAVIPGRNPIFDVRFALQNHPVPDVSMPGIEVEYRTRSTGTSRFDLACELTEIGKTMEVVWLFREDMFSPSDVERLHHHFNLLLVVIGEESNATIANLIDRLS